LTEKAPEALKTANKLIHQTIYKMKQKFGLILLAVFLLTGCTQALQINPVPMQASGSTTAVTASLLPSHTVAAAFTALLAYTLTPPPADTSHAAPNLRFRLKPLRSAAGQVQPSRER